MTAQADVGDDVADSGTKVVTTSEDLRLRGPSLSSWVALLTAVSIFGYGYWKIAAYVGARKLGLTYDGIGVVEAARIVPNTWDGLAAVVAMFVALVALLIGRRSVRTAKRTCGVLAVLVIIAIALPSILTGQFFWSGMLGIVIGLALGGVVGGLAGIDIHVEAAPTAVQKEERHLFLSGWLVSLCVYVGVQVAGGLAYFAPYPVVVVVVPDLSREVLILRSDSAGHLALDENARLMWLSRSKVSEIRGRIVDKKK